MGNKQTQPTQDFLYSVPVTEKIKGETAVYRHPQYKDKLHEFYSDETKQTLRDCFVHIFQTHPNVNFLGTKSVDKVYHFKTYGQCFEIIQQLGSGIYNMNLAPQIQEYKDYKIRPIGIMSRNREEWLLVDLTAALYGFVSTALFSTMPDIHYSIKLAGMQTVFGSKEGLDDLMKVEGNLPPIKTYVCFDPFTDNDVNLAKGKGIDIIPYEKVLGEGKKHLIDCKTIQINPDDLQSFVFTSGTTGMPKCTMLSHKNIIGQFTSQIQDRKCPNFIMFDQELSLAPYAHEAEKIVGFCLVATASTIYYSSYIPEQLLSEYQQARPTILISATRFFNKIYYLIMEKMNKQGCFKRYLFRKALDAKLANLKKGQLKHAFWDKLIFNKIKHAIIGDRLRVMTAGAQPCNEVIFNTLRVIFGVPFIQVFGLTECIAQCFETSPDDFTSIGHVGGPTVTYEFKLVDKPEYGYFTDAVDEQGKPTPKGEILLRGPQVTQGYYKNQDETDKLINKDGFLMTGDVGQLLPNGAVKILDRTKNVFKLLSYPNYICPEVIENIYNNIQFFDQNYLYGDYLKEHCVAIVQPKKDQFQAIAKTLNVTGSYEEICKNQKMYDYTMQAIQQESEKSKVQIFEQPKKIYIESKTFAELGLLTISLKIQRAKIRQYYKSKIDELYQKN